ncbi:MAG: glycosyltransferase family 39 protein [Desulfomonilaceae bacterium]|nr:glycosyltransferase family 39 protein [Desulfomonilaceae bacterium]
MMTRDEKGTLVWILAAAFAIRAAIPLIAYGIAGDVAVFHNPDTMEYVLPAKSLLNGGSYAVDGVPEIVRTPGYSLLLVPGILLGHLELVTILLQVTAGVFTVFLVYKLGMVLWQDARVAVTAAALYAVEPLAITYASFLFTETFFTTFLTAGGLFLVRNLTTGRTRDAAIAGGLLAAAAYVRPIAMFLPFPIACAMILFDPRGKRLSRRSLAQPIAFLAVFVILVVPWQVRNYVHTGYFGFSAISDHNLHFSTQAAILAHETGVPFLTVQERMGFTDPDVYFGLHPEQREWSQAEIAQWRKREGINAILQYPRTYVLLALEAAVWAIRDTAASGYITLFAVDPSSSWGSIASMTLKGACAVLLLGYYFFAGVAVVYRGIFRDARIACMVVVCAYFILTAAATGIGFARFRLPIMPILCALAAYGIPVAMERMRRASR